MWKAVLSKYPDSLPTFPWGNKQSVCEQPCPTPGETIHFTTVATPGRTCSSYSRHVYLSSRQTLYCKLKSNTVSFVRFFIIEWRHICVHHVCNPNPAEVTSPAAGTAPPVVLPAVRREARRSAIKT